MTNHAQEKTTAEYCKEVIKRIEGSFKHFPMTNDKNERILGLLYEIETIINGD